MGCQGRTGLREANGTGHWEERNTRPVWGCCPAQLTSSGKRGAGGQACAGGRGAELGRFMELREEMGWGELTGYKAEGKKSCPFCEGKSQGEGGRWKGKEAGSHGASKE